MKNKGLSVLLTILCMQCSFAQQYFTYSLYSFNRLLINPAYAGTNNMVQTSLEYKNYLAGIEGAPVTQTLTINAPIPSKHLGVGLKLISEQIGATQQFNVLPVISYYIGLGNGRLSFGLEGGVFNESLNWDELIRTSPDNAIPVGKASITKPDAGFGTYYLAQRFYVGVAINHLIKSKLNYTEINTDAAGFLTRHYFLETGLFQSIGENIMLEPSILLKYLRASPVQLDMNVKATFKNRITAGISYRSGAALYFPVRIKINEQFAVGYSYDLTMSKLSTQSMGSHEIMINYNYILHEPKRKKDISPRYYF